MRTSSYWTLFSILGLAVLAHSYNYKTYFYWQKVPKDNGSMSLASALLTLQAYTAQVDHFSFTTEKVFLQRYLVNDKSWEGNNAPIFFYAGNEGDITMFAENTGFMFDIAPEFKALVVFAEHRYYGVSTPFGSKSFTDPKYSGYLSSEQALADYAELLTHLKRSIPGAQGSPVIVFGGSYGGMLAAWFRMKYPHIVQGAIAASAPILQFTDMTPYENFGRVVTADYAKESDECVEVIRKSWNALNTVTADDDGKKWLTSAWNLCDPLVSDKNITDIKAYLMDVWTNLAMVDYPYEANFLAPLPAYPIKVICTHLTDSSKNGRLLLEELFDGLTVYFNYTGESKCLNYNQQADVRLDDRGWDYQACTEMVMPFTYDGVNDFFEPSPWNYISYAEECKKKWGVSPRPRLAELMYGGTHIKASSNIVFSNGLLDPWSSGGVMWNVSETVVSVIIPEGAHHLDLRGSHPKDPQSVIDARLEEKRHIKRWIAGNTQNHEQHEL